jgi:large subunit ribosomal protein L10
MDTTNYNAKVNPRNQVFADKIRAHAKNYSILGIVDVSGLPAPQFQRIRAKLNKTAKILIVKKNIIEIVLSELESTHKGVSELFSKCSGVVGLVFTNDNPFSLYKFIKKNKSAAPAKSGQVAPNDIVVPAGPTSFAPGPIIGELGALKIKAGINAGKVEIKEDSLVAKEGDVISAELAGVLSRLGIEPMEVGLNLKAICEDSVIYGKDVLDVDEEALLADLKSEALRSFKLSIGLEYYTKENISHFITEGARDSLGLGVGIAYPAAETIKRLVSKANAQMSGVAMALPVELRPAGVAVAAPVAAATTESAPANEGKKEEKAAPADAAAGLGSLF